MEYDALEHQNLCRNRFVAQKELTIELPGILFLSGQERLKVVLNKTGRFPWTRNSLVIVLLCSQND